jgi:hypothetical protein
MFIEKRHPPFTPHARLKNKGEGEGKKSHRAAGGSRQLFEAKAKAEVKEK